MSDLKSLLCQRPDSEWARLLGCTERAVASWRYGARRPSLPMAIKLEEVGQIGRHVSRPDVWPVPLRPDSPR